MDQQRGLEFRKIRYNPLPTQKLFHSSDARFKGFSGPVGSGKSQALCQEAVRLAYLNPGRTGMMGAPTFPMLRDATQAALLATLEENRIPFDLNKAENVLTFGDCGSRIVFRSTDEFDRLRGTNLAWFGVDELSYTAEEAWIRLEARLRDPQAKRLCGFAVWTPRGFDWVYRRFVAKTIDGYEVFFAKPYENRHILKTVPDYYERLRTSYDERFFAQEVLGEYLSVSSGRVYTSFERSRNVSPVRVDPSKQLLWALDFNVNPMCSVIAQMQGERLVILDEIVLKKATTRMACEEFVRRYPNHPGDVRIFGDASGHRDQTVGGSDYGAIRAFMNEERYSRVGFEVPRSNPSVKARVSLVNEKLRAPDGLQLIVDPRCCELIRDFDEVCYKGESGELDKDRDASRTHLSDALGYLIWERLRPMPPVGFQPLRFM